MLLFILDAEIFVLKYVQNYKSSHIINAYYFAQMLWLSSNIDQGVVYNLML